MKLKFFTIPALSPEDAEAELNRFLGAHRIAHIERQFIADGENRKGAGASVGPDSKARRRPDFPLESS